MQKISFDLGLVVEQNDVNNRSSSLGLFAVLLADDHKNDLVLLFLFKHLTKADSVLSSGFSSFLVLMHVHAVG